MFTAAENKIVYLSRQSNEKSLDMQMLEKEIKTLYPEYKQVFRTRTLEKGFWSGLKYLCGLIGDMYHIAGAKVAICDTYSVTISCLQHKKSIKIIQMWHALGAIKKFGLQSVGFAEGRDKKISHAMCMHKNYDIVIAPSKATAQFYEEAFGVEEQNIKIASLPQVDYMLDGKNLKSEFLEKNPEVKGKKIVMYIPTFRENENEIVKELNTIFEQEEDIKLFVSLHPYSRVEKKDDFKI